MEYEIIREPFIFRETEELLSKYVNGVTFSGIKNGMRTPGISPIRQKIEQRLDILQSIMDEVCQDVDINDPKLRKYFAYAGSDPSQDYQYLAKYLVDAFVEVKNPGFEETVADIYAEWEHMNAARGWFVCGRGMGLHYSCEPGSPGDLFEQIYALDLPADFRLRLCGSMHKFPEALEELAGLMRPVAKKLEIALKRAQPILDEVLEYWVTSPVAPLEFLESVAGADAVKGAGERVRLVVLLMNPSRVMYSMANSLGRSREYSHVHMGCGVTRTSMTQKESDMINVISAALKSISEKKRLEILRRLARKRYYGQELADAMNIDAGNLSRTLAALYSQGFLRQERENLRTYYQTDREGVQHFLDSLLKFIFE